MTVTPESLSVEQVVKRRVRFRLTLITPYYDCRQPSWELSEAQVLALRDAADSQTGVSLRKAQRQLDAALTFVERHPGER